MSVKDSKILKVVYHHNKRKIILPSTYKLLCIKLQQGFNFDAENIKLIIKEKNIEIKDEQSYKDKIKELDENDIVIVLDSEMPKKLEKAIEHLQNYKKKLFKDTIFAFSSFIQNLKSKKFKSIKEEKCISFQLNTNTNNKKETTIINKLESRTPFFCIDTKTVLKSKKDRGKEVKNDNLPKRLIPNRDREIENQVKILQVPSINQEFIDKFINEMDELFKIKSKYDNSKLEEEKKKLKTKEDLISFFEKEDYISLNSYPKKIFQLNYKFAEVNQS